MTEQVSIAKSAKIVGRHLCTGPNDLSFYKAFKSFIQGVPKKTLFSGILAITPLWKVLELKVGGVSKTSKNSLCDRHKNFPNSPFRS